MVTETPTGLAVAVADGFSALNVNLSLSLCLGPFQDPKGLDESNRRRF